MPFSSETKQMRKFRRSGKENILFVKGALEHILLSCDYVLINGSRIALTPALKKEIIGKEEEFARSALRVLAFAIKPKAKDLNEKGLTFVGLQAMIDPPRKEVKDSIITCHKAGIRVVMITGDHKITAQAIAQELGIVGQTVSGAELDELSDAELLSKVKQIGIYARVSPTHKLRIVQALQHHKEIVAMTGDGVNDAPALKRADIGIAMGISGTDVAKEASQMILVDDNFTSIVNAIEEGRNIYDNIKKFVNYLLSSNFSEILIIGLAGLAGFPLPLIAAQILWMNLITDGFPAIALSNDPVSPQTMSKSPKEFGAHIIDKRMMKTVFVIGSIMALSTLSVFWYVLAMSGIETARTVAFTTIVLLELVRLYIIRGEYGETIFSNKTLLAAIGISFFLQYIAIYGPLQVMMRTVPLGVDSWIAILVTIVAASLVALFAKKTIIQTSSKSA